MNPFLKSLHAYPFERLAVLLSDVQPAALAPISMSIGEPQHPAPAFVLSELQRHFSGYSNYPKTAGIAGRCDGSLRSGRSAVATTIRWASANGPVTT